MSFLKAKKISLKIFLSIFSGFFFCRWVGAAVNNVLPVIYTPTHRHTIIYVLWMTIFRNFFFFLCMLQLKYYFFLSKHRIHFLVGIYLPLKKSIKFKKKEKGIVTWFCVVFCTQSQILTVVVVDNVYALENCMFYSIYTFCTLPWRPHTRTHTIALELFLAILYSEKEKLENRKLWTDKNAHIQ